VATLAAILSRLLYGLLVLLNRLSAALSHSRSRLHNARFAHLHELASLQAGNAPGDLETSLLLGVGELSRVLRVRPTRTRRELGNLLVVAPTRGGKGLLATSQLLTWRGSVVVNDIKGCVKSNPIKVIMGWEKGWLLRTAQGGRGRRHGGDSRSTGFRCRIGKPKEARTGLTVAG
jgi:hypothetical protein